MSTLGDRPFFPSVTLRHYLAGQALTGLCANTGLYDSRTPGAEEKNALVRTAIAEAVVAIADATLKELAKEGR